jgi:uncharacterized damage-inducible protein DinB
MEIKEYIRQAYEYMYWATGRYFAVAEGLTDEQLHQVQGHGWGDIHGTLVHMMSSEWVWMQRWQGSTPAGHLDKAAYPTLAALKARWAEVQSEMRAFIEQQTEESLRAEITYSNFRGETFHVPLWQMLAHIVNHETHHRGELAAMYALMDVSHPEDEMIQFFLNASGQKKF